MRKDKKNLLLMLSSILSLLICTAVIIPFSITTVLEIESLLKFIVAPALIVILTIPAMICQRQELKKESAFSTANVIIPFLYYLASASFYLLTLILRAGYSNVLQAFPNLDNLLILSCIFGGFAFTCFLCSILMPVVKVKMKKGILVGLFDSLFIVIMAGVAVIAYLETNKNSGIAFSENVGYNINFSLICAFATIAILMTVLIVLAIKDTKNSLVAVERQKEIEQCQDDVLAGMYKYAREQLIARGYVLDQENVVYIEKEVTKPQIIERVIEVERIVEKIVPSTEVKEKLVKEEVQKPVKEVQESIKEEVQEPIKEEVQEPVKEEVQEPVKEEVKEPVKEEVQKENPQSETLENQVPIVDEKETIDTDENVVKEAPKEKVFKPIKPSVRVLVKYAEENLPDTNIVYGKTEEDFKIYRNKKLILDVQRTTSDYRVVFQRKPALAAKLIVKYPTLITKPKTPKGDQWFKIINKGEVGADELCSILKLSHKFILDEEEKAALKKEKDKEKAALKKQKEREKLKEKEKAQKAKEKEKEKAKTATKKKTTPKKAVSPKANTNIDANDIALATAQVVENSSNE